MRFLSVFLIQKSCGTKHFRAAAFDDTNNIRGFYA